MTLNEPNYPALWAERRIDSFCTFGDIVRIQDCLKTIWGKEETDSN